MGSWKRKIGIVRDPRLKNQAKLRGAVRRQDVDIMRLQGELEGCRDAYQGTTALLRAAIRAVNWQRFYAEISAVALLRILEKHANALYQEVEGAWTCYPTPSPRLQDVSDSGLVVF